MKNALAALTLACCLAAPLGAETLQLRELKTPPLQAIDPYIGEQIKQIAADSVPAIQQQAEAGDAAAQFKLGIAHAAAIGVARDDAQSLAWINKAAANGNANGQYFLGLVYYFGGEKYGGGDYRANELKALEWLRKAADQGHVHAQTMLDILHEEGGRQIRKNRGKAVEWFRKAAAQGDPTAKEALRMMRSKGQSG
jgi:TPR repeat protein